MIGQDTDTSSGLQAYAHVAKDIPYAYHGRGERRRGGGGRRRRRDTQEESLKGKKTHAFCYSGPSLSGQAWPSGWTQSTPYQSR